MEAALWAWDEAAEARLGDRRRNRALARILTGLLQAFGRSFSAGLGEAVRQAASNLLARPGLSVADLLAGHYRATASRCAAETMVLVSQDSTSFNYSTRRSITGLGRLSDKAKARGIWAHSALALTLAGRPLGLLSLRFWSRSGSSTRAHRRQRSYREKESYKWEQGLREVEQALPLETSAVVVSDRESDVFEYLRAPLRSGMYKLVRAAWQRRSQAVGAADRHLWQALQTAVREAPKAQEVTLTVTREERTKPNTKPSTKPGTKPNSQPSSQQAAQAEAAEVAGAACRARPTRVSRLEVRFTSLRIGSPKSWPAAERDEIILQVIAVDEQDPPPGVVPLSWTLLTTYPVTTAAAALEVLSWYQRRWRVEQAHRALKRDGYQVERLQFRSLQALQLALAMYWVVAWRAMNLALEARDNPDLPAAARFAAEELEVLSLLRGEPVETLGTAVAEVAKLDGWAGYRSSPPPGVQVVQRGLEKLAPLTAYHRALKASGRLQEPPQ
jgi:hypothetical protein